MIIKRYNSYNPFVYPNRFENIEDLNQHVLRHDKRGNVCDICAKVVRGNAAFEDHKLEHENLTADKLQCEECGSWHKNKNTLKIHKRRHTNDTGPEACDICQKIYVNRGAMLRHRAFVHNTTAKFQCSACNKAFKKSLNLREHLAIHTGAPMYRCLHCPKTFNSIANLHSHRKKVHPVEFEEIRKQRRENAHLPGPPQPAIVQLCRNNINPSPSEQE